MKPRLPAALVTIVAVGGAFTAPAAHAEPSTTVVISKIMTRGPLGGNDEVIELKNKSAAPVAIGGWQLWGSNVNGSAQSARATITAGTELAPEASLSVDEQPRRPDGRNQTYSSGIADDGGLQLRSSAAATSVIDAVGSTSLTSAGTVFREGTAPPPPGLDFPTVNGDNAFVRKAGGSRTPTRTRPTSCARTRPR